MQTPIADTSSIVITVRVIISWYSVRVTRIAHVDTIEAFELCKHQGSEVRSSVRCMMAQLIEGFGEIILIL